MAMSHRSSKLLVRCVFGASNRISSSSFSSSAPALRVASWSRCSDALDKQSSAQFFPQNLRAQHPVLTSSLRYYAATTTVKSGGQDVPAECSEQIKDLYGKFMNEVEGKRTVPVSLVRNMIEVCNCSQDTELAFRVLQKYRIYRSAKARVKQNFNENISNLIVSACLRTKCYDLALKTLWKHNVYGLNPSIDNAHLILGHAKHNKDTDLMMKTYNTMLKNSLIPSTQTVNIMIRTCKDKGELDLMFNLAQEFLENRVKLSVAAFDILISTAASFGSVENVYKAQKWREEAGIDHTVASLFSVAKANLLEGKPSAGVELIAKHCQDKVMLNKYLSMLVRVWPSELFAKKNETPEEGFAAGLKENVIVFANALSKKFRCVRIDADEEFAKGNLNRKDDPVDDVPRFSAM